MQINTTGVAWFEIPVEIFSRAKYFYSRVFECTIPTQQIDSHFVGLLTFGLPQAQGAIICAEGYIPSERGPLIFLNPGLALAPLLERVNEYGGEVLAAAVAIPGGAGHYAIIRDSEGNRLGISAADE